MQIHTQCFFFFFKDLKVKSNINFKFVQNTMCPLSIYLVSEMFLDGEGLTHSESKLQTYNPIIFANY